MIRFAVFIAALTLLSATTPISSAATSTRNHLAKPDDWFRTPEAKTIAANILSYQSPLGGWPKNTDTAAAPYAGDPAKLQPTFDNSATTDELRLLARMFNATHDAQYQRAFEKGLSYILIAQYPTGGWPQFHPPSTQYHRHITFNDNTMVRLMIFLREVATGDLYAFVPADQRRAAQQAFDRGVQCILKCQIKVNDKLTGWCAQHDEKDYSPRPGRTYELVSLSGSESVAIVQLLMSLDNPSPEVVQSIESVIAWFQSARLQGIEVVLQDDPQASKGRNKVVVQDPSAPPLWARFYDISTNRPIYCDRDGIPKPNLADIGYERRNGYAWLGDWPRDLLEKQYPAWRVKYPSSHP